jgi:hypothetical protein
MAVTGPLAVVAFGCWLFWPHALDTEADSAINVLYAVYQLLVLLTLSAGIVAALSHAQVATARAFTAGYNAGLAVAEAAEDAAGQPLPKSRRPRPLRLVE